MRKNCDGSRARRGYHHGNLKEALVDAGRQLIIEKGPHGFSLVEAARIANVSPAAPYRHYANRDALLIEIAKRGFQRFADQLEKAWNDGMPDPLSAFERMGDAYLNFARQDRASYAAMFEAGLEGAADNALDDLAQRSFEALLRVAQQFRDALPVSDDRPSAELIFAHIWSLSHGIARLYGGSSGGVCAETNDLPPEEILRSGVRTYLKGLGIE